MRIEDNTFWVANPLEEDKGEDFPKVEEVKSTKKANIQCPLGRNIDEYA